MYTDDLKVKDRVPQDGYVNVKGDLISKDYKLIRPIGGKQTVHTRDCSYIQNYSMKWMEEVKKLQPEKMHFCYNCIKYVLIASTAKDYLEHNQEYHRIFDYVPFPVIRSFYTNKTSVEMEIVNNRLFIHADEDHWYIDFTLLEIDAIRLFHNNYNRKIRDTGDVVWTRKGYHEQDLRGSGNSMIRAIKTISWYSYQGARESHERKRKGDELSCKSA